MANLTLKSIATLVADQAAATQSKASALIDFSVGSVLRSVAEANAAVAVWLQALVLQVLSVTRLSTSTGSDIDSFVNDWGVTRLAATISAGSVTFSRFTSDTSAVIPLGATVQTADASQTFAVIEDSTNTSWSASAGGYLLPVGVPSITVPVQSTASGTAANVAAGAVNVMTTAISGVDYVTNALPFSGGSNAETDAALQARFVLFISSLSKATIAAIIYAINSLELGLQCQIVENENYDGSYRPGYLTIIVDDGSGAPSTGLVAAASAAVANVRAAGIMWGVFPPIVLEASIQMLITTAAGYDHDTVIAAVGAAITQYVNALPLGTSLPYSRLAQLAYAASPGVTNVTSIALNSGTGDLTASPANVIKLLSLTVS